MLRPTLAVLTLSAIFFADSYATTWYVKPDGTGGAPTIQAGIDSAVAGDTVSLKNGTYTGDGNRDIDFLGKAIVVRSELGEPSWCVIDCEGSPTDYHRGFHLHSGEDSTSVLEGLTITNGYLGDGGRGAGILCENASAPTMKNCSVTDNNIYSAGQGGALYCSGASIKIDNCEFRDNQTQRQSIKGGHLGGGIYADACTLTINDSYFLGNWGGWGGGVHCRNSVLSVVRSTFSGNTAYAFTDNDYFAGGGGIYGYASDVVLKRCFFIDNNVASRGGGGVYLAGSGSDAIFSWCVFSNNRTSWGGPGSGGAVRCGDSASFSDCTFFNNGYLEGNGGGVSCGSGSVFTRCRFERNSTGWSINGGGGVWCNSGTFDDCEFIDNYANTGGGVWSLGTAEFTNCLFVGNAEEGVAAGNAAFANCTFTHNLGIYNGAFSTDYGPVYAENTIIAFNSAFDTTYFSPVTLICCDVYGNEDGDWVGPLAGQDTVNGNFSAHPMFCDPDNGDFTLASFSECLPMNNGCGVLIGAYGQGCDYAVGVPDDLVPSPSQATITAYPNPFNPTTTIEYFIPNSGEVTIRLFDVSGRLVTTLVERHEAEGFHAVTWDGTDLRGHPVSSGIYFVRFESGVQVQTRKIVLLK